MCALGLLALRYINWWFLRRQPSLLISHSRPFGALERSVLTLLGQLWLGFKNPMEERHRGSNFALSCLPGTLK